jgi:site-specific recombinase XerD
MSVIHPLGWRPVKAVVAGAGEKGSPLGLWLPCVFDPRGERIELGDPLVDEYLELVRARARRNTLLATAYDLRVFFGEVSKPPLEVTPGDVLAFVRAQRNGQPSSVVRITDGSSGLAVSTVRRRLSSLSGFYGYLVATGRMEASPVLRGVATAGSRRRGHRGSPVLRRVRRLPQVLEPAEVVTLLGALRKWRDRAMVEAMVLGGLRRAEVLGLRFEDLRTGERRVFVADGKGGHQRLVPMSGRFFASVASYLDTERPAQGSDPERVFVVLKGPNRGRSLTAKGLEEIMAGARRRAGLEHATCHELRHTCLTRLREAGMALEAVQAQAGHRSIESTRIYLHLANDWLAGEYQRAAEAIDTATGEGPQP